MNTSTPWDAEPRQSAPVPPETTVVGPAEHDRAEPLGAAPESVALHVAEPDPTAAGVAAGDRRRLALGSALASLDDDATTSDAVTTILDALDKADAEAGIARVDTGDVVLQQRIARIVSGAALPSRGPSTRAREILALLGEGGAA